MASASRSPTWRAPHLVRKGAWAQPREDHLGADFLHRFHHGGVHGKEAGSARHDRRHARRQEGLDDADGVGRRTHVAASAGVSGRLARVGPWPSDTFGALRERRFRLLWLGQATSTLGDGLLPVALVFAVIETLDGTATALGLVLAAHTLPLVAFVLIGGVWADRLPRQLVMLASDLIRCASRRRWRSSS